ncbi:hypothetical protein [Sphingobium sp.]|uniref:hypothetical protein n=1 Tax=Sphingobium sp. TaxID=1912891 RepID=UPI003BB50B46
MSKAKTIVEAASFEALDAAISAATVYQDAPSNASGDLVILGDLRSSALPGKAQSDDRRVQITIITLVSAEERAPLLALMDQVEVALDGVTIERDGWTLEFTFEDDDAVLSEDGETYTGVSSFAVLCLAP